jgi:hypothetical protein
LEFVFQRMQSRLPPFYEGRREATITLVFYIAGHRDSDDPFSSIWNTRSQSIWDAMWIYWTVGSDQSNQARYERFWAHP